ncbi:MAG: 3-hydroxyacyl-CoA dehydrogenase [Pseudomonadota bacterium]
MANLACVGAGNVGRAWAIAFARGGHTVRLYDRDADAVQQALALIGENVDDLKSAGLVGEDDVLLDRITIAPSLAVAVDGAVHVQESVKEDLSIKCAVFEEIDSLAPPDVVIASSSSAFLSSKFVGGTQHPSRCLVAHPFNPPYLIPLVELCGHPGTDPDLLERTQALMVSSGMSPIVLKKEIKAFLLNRLQSAVLSEAMFLVGEGYCSAEDLDRAMSDGLGLRWSFMGPFMTGHLNASGGFRDYVRLLGDAFQSTSKELCRDYDWSPALVDTVANAMEAKIPADRVSQGQRWRDRRLMAQRLHKRSQPGFTDER